MRAAISALAFLAGVSPAIAGKGWERPEGSWGRHGKPGGYWGASPASTAATGTGSGASSSIPSGWNATSSSSSLSKSSSPVTSETVIVSPIGSGNGGLQQPATVTVTAVVTSVVTSINSICALPSSSLGGAGGIGGYGSWSPSQSGAAGSNAGSGSNNGESRNGASIVNAASNNNAYSNGGAATTAQATQTFVPVPYGDYTPSGWGTQAWGPSTVTYISSVETTITSVLTQLTTKMQGGSTTTSTQYSTITLTSTIPVTVTSTTTYTSIPTTLSIEQPTGPIGPVTISFSSTPSASSSKGGNVGNGGNGGYGGSSWTGSGSASVSSGSASTGPASIGPVSTDTTSTGIVSSGTISSSASTSSTPASPTWPACWTACWAQYNVTSLRLACSNSLSKACINSTCSAADASQYAAWVSSGCPALNTTSSISSTASATGTISGPASGSTSSSVSGPVSGSTSSTIGVNGTSGSSSLSQTSYTTYTTTCSENGTTTIHTHSQVVSPTTYPAANTTTAGPTGATSSSTVSTSSYPAGNSTTVGPTGSGSTSIPATSYTTFVTTCTENGTTTLHTHSQVVSPTTYPAGNTTTAGPTGSGSTSIPATSYTTFVTTCTENGTTTLHTHSQVVSPTTYPAGNTTTASPTGGATASTSPYPAGNSSTVGPTGTGSATWPTHTECVPCEGQPGSDPDKFCGYTIKDNPYQVTPKTCRTKVFHFDIQNVTIAPDGVERIALAVNGQVPGPLVEAYWGDQIVVHVKNSMQNNGSTIHWHGQRQNYTNDQDGVASITQCPIAPGETYTYTFTANNFGYSWYHAHYILQAYEGVYGPMLIHGPKSVEGNYDEVPIAINDWSHVPVSEMYDAAQAVGPRPATGPRTMDTSLINGVNVWQDGGKRWELDVVKGETKILHFLNAAIQSTYVFYIDGHSFQVIANDYVPIIPYTTNHVVFNPGQRYSILITFDQAVDNYWLRADNQNSCSNTTDWDNIKAIIRYKGASKTDPTSTAVSYTPGCGDESLANLVPAYEMTVGVTHAAPIAETVLIAGNGGSPNVYKWTLNGVTFDSEWGSPSLLSIYENGTVPSYSGPLAVEVPNLHEWVYFIIQSPIPFPHPIHLHGHDFFVLAQGTGMYANTTLNLENPPRRDTAMMPWDPVAGLGGHLVLAFETDNPGAWLMHCHIGWHNSMGFALQIIEAKSQIAGTISDKWGKQLQDTCSAYNSWANTYDVKTDDSGV